MREIKVWKDPFDCKLKLCKAKTVSFEPGLTVLVGCNGAGKTTMLSNISAELTDQDVPVIQFSNLNDGADKIKSSAAAKGHFETVSQLLMASEGEGINISILTFVKEQLNHFLKTGKKQLQGLERIFCSEEYLAELEKPSECNERWILLDATDSGLSIDNICDLKELIASAIDALACKNIETYFIVSANEFEMASGEDCLDVISGNHIQFTRYEDFKDFIMSSKKLKMKRYEKKTKEIKEKS